MDEPNLDIVNAGGDDTPAGAAEALEARIKRLEGMLDQQTRRADEMSILVERMEHLSQSSPRTDTSEIVTAVTTAMRGLPNVASLPSPPTYSGDTDSLEWSTFVELFEKNLTLNNWDNLPTTSRAQLLQSCLRMQAANVFHSLSDEQKDNYDSAVRALTGVFLNPAKTTLFQNQ
jgi:hypothetical protein